MGSPTTSLTGSARKTVLKYKYGESICFPILSGLDDSHGGMIDDTVQAMARRLSMRYPCDFVAGRSCAIKLIAGG
jgi:hypothetical protein